MCGIGGVLGFNKEDSKIRISKMLSSIKHRGPDSLNIIYDHGFAFGTTRLKIEAIDYGEQPIMNDRYIIGFNGEIFNYKSLIKNLGLNKNAEESEIKFLLEWWQKRGINFIQDLEGQFVIYVYDKFSQELYLIRDRYGIRPVHYYFKDSELFFCSEIKGIVSAREKTFDINDRAFAQVAMFWTPIGSNTAFSGVKQVRPSHYLKWASGVINEYQYCVNYLITETPIKIAVNDASKLLEQSLEKSIISQIHGSVGHACYLSGGIDSGMLAYYLTKNASTKLDTFSISFENPEYDESAAQISVSKFLGSNHRSIRINRKDITSNFQKTVNHSETFLFRTAAVPLYLLSKLVKESGHKVIFTGEGADEVLLGYDLFFEQRIRRFWNRQPNSKARAELLKKLYYYLPQFRQSRYFEILKDFYRGSLRETDSIFYSHFVRWAQFKQVSSYFNLNDVDNFEKELMHEINELMPININNISYDRRAQLLEMETLLSNYLLSSQGDRMTMANSVEGRYPYLGEEFTKKMAQLADTTKALGLSSKKILRLAAKDILPSEVVNRPKVAYQAPEAKSFIDHNYISDEAQDLNERLDEFSIIRKKEFQGLNAKISNEHSSSRLGFRENMAYIMAMSYKCLSDSQKFWSKNEY